MSFQSFLVNSGYLMLFINTILYFKSYRKFSVAFKILTCYLLLNCIIQFYGSYLASLKENNLFLMHYYINIQFVLLSIFFLNSFKNKILKKITFYNIFLILLILAFIIHNSENYYYTFNIPEIVLLNVPLIIYSFIYFIEKLDATSKKYIYFNAGFFVYLTCSTLLFSAGNIKSEIKNLLWLFNQSLYIVFQLLIFIEWYKNFRKKEKTDNLNT